MLRCFEDGDVTHVEGSVDPMRDAEIVETELMLADLDSLEKRLPNLEKRAKGGDKEAAGRSAGGDEGARRAARRQARPRGRDHRRRSGRCSGCLQLITAKPVLYV